MFKYVSSRNHEVTQIYCLLLTSVIADCEGWSIDDSRTELADKSNVISRYYRAYYTFIAGSYNEKKKNAEGFLTPEVYYRDYYSKIQMKYDLSRGKDSFLRLGGAEQFLLVFQNILLPTVVNSVRSVLRDYGLSDEQIKNNEDRFRSDFNTKYICRFDELSTLNTTMRDLWRELYDFAFSMPHAIIGMRKIVSAEEPSFFRANKDNLDSIVDYLRATGGLVFSNYRDRLLIAGIIVNHFKAHLLRSWFKEYGCSISAGNSTYVDSDGNVLNLSDTQDRIFANNTKFDIQNFEKLMKSIDKGSELYTVGKSRYFNLLAWRQNKMLYDVQKSINSSTVLVDKLKSLGLVIGGYKDIIDIATTMGVKSNDKIERFTELDHMITKVYESYIDSESARSFVDEFFKRGNDLYARGKAKNGNYPMDFKYDGDRFVTINKMAFDNMIRGIQSLKILETSVLKLGYTLLSLPHYGKTNAPFELTTGISFRDYINGQSYIDDTIIIECDIECEEQLPGCVIYEDVNSMSNELTRILHLKKTDEKISWDSLTDEELALTVDRAADKELLRLFKEYGINMRVSSSRNVKSFHDAIFTEIVNELEESENDNVLSIRSYLGVIQKMQDNRRKGITEKVNTTGCYLAKIRYLAQVISRMAMYGNITEGLSSKAEDYAKYYREDDEGNYLDVLYLREYDVDDGQLSKLYGFNIDDSNRAEYAATCYCDAGIQYHFATSKYVGFKYSNKCPIFVASDGSGNSRETLLSMFFRATAKLTLDMPMYQALRNACDHMLGTVGRITDSEFNSDDKLYLPRSICYGINIGIVIESLLAAIGNIKVGIGELNNIKINTNDEKQINVRACIKSIIALDAMYSPHTGMDAYRKLKMYEDVYNSFFESIIRDYGAYNKNNKDDKFYKFVFMCSLQDVCGVKDIDERLSQYEEITKLLHQILTNIGLFYLTMGNKTYSILEYLNVLNAVLTSDKKSADREYNVDMVAITTLTQEQQELMRVAYNKLLANDGSLKERDSSDTWIESLVDYCETYRLKLSSNILNSIRMKSDEYMINKYGFITLNNRVVHTNIYHDNSTSIAFVTEYGLFTFDGVTVMPLRKVDDLHWLLH